MGQDSLLPFKYKDVLRTLNEYEVSFLLIGGMNFFLAHQPVSTQDVDVFIEDSPENRRRCEQALSAMNAEWGRNDADWGLVRDKVAGWLSQQHVYCLLTKYGPLDVFRSLKGVDSFEEANARATVRLLDGGIKVPLLASTDLLACQLVLPEQCRRLDRVAYLQRLLDQ